MAVAEASLPLFAAAMRRVDAAEDLARVEARPSHVTCGLRLVDALLGGGFPVGGLTLVAARPKMGATSLLIGASLANLKLHQPVAYFTELMRDEQLRGRFVVLEARVNGYRFRAGFVSAEDRVALAAARERIAWSHLSIEAHKQVLPERIDAGLFSYRPWLVVVEAWPRARTASRAGGSAQAFRDFVERLAMLARRHHVAMVLKHVLPRGDAYPSARELPDQGQLAQLFDSTILLHRYDVEAAGDDSHAAGGDAEVRVVRRGGVPVDPSPVHLRFDQRFAGLVEAP